MPTDSYYELEQQAVRTLLKMVTLALETADESMMMSFKVYQPTRLRDRFFGNTIQPVFQKGLVLFRDEHGPVTYLTTTLETKVPAIASRRSLIREDNLFTVKPVVFYVRDRIFDEFALTERMAHRAYFNTRCTIAELLPEDYPLDEFIPEGLPPQHPRYTPKPIIDLGDTKQEGQSAIAV